MPSMLSGVTVEYYGAPTPLQNLATVSTPDAGSLVVKPFDKTSLKNIEDAIIDAGLGFNPSNDGEIIRINVPQLTEERRKELAKVCTTWMLGASRRHACRGSRCHHSAAQHYQAAVVAGPVAHRSSHHVRFVSHLLKPAHVRCWGVFSYGQGACVCVKHQGIVRKARLRDSEHRCECAASAHLIGYAC